MECLELRNSDYAENVEALRSFLGVKDEGAWRYLVFLLPDVKSALLEDVSKWDGMPQEEFKEVVFKEELLKAKKKADAMWHCLLNEIVLAPRG